MDLREFQRLAAETNQLRHDEGQPTAAPILGLAGEAGAILALHKTYLREGVDAAAYREVLAEELGDLLWYAAAVATATGLDLADVAAANLRRVRDLYPTAADREQLAALPVLDAAYPAGERFPRRLVVELKGRREPDGRVFTVMRLASAQPNPFPDGPRATDGGQVIGFQVGAQLGDSLAENPDNADEYRFHDAIHFGFLAVLGWSPAMRALLRLRRRSDPATLEYEDGPRAVFVEEGLAAVLSRLARRRAGFLTEAAVTGDVVDVVRATVADFEVKAMPGWVWRRAICHGFRALRELDRHGGGYLVANLDTRTLSYTTDLAGLPATDPPRAR